MTGKKQRLTVEQEQALKKICVIGSLMNVLVTVFLSFFSLLIFSGLAFVFEIASLVLIGRWFFIFRKSKKEGRTISDVQQKIAESENKDNDVANGTPKKLSFVLIILIAVGALVAPLFLFAIVMPAGGSGLMLLPYYLVVFPIIIMALAHNRVKSSRRGISKIHVVMAVIGLCCLVFNLLTLSIRTMSIIIAVEQADDDLVTLANDKGVEGDNEFKRMIYTVCERASNSEDGDYEIVYQEKENTGIFHCNSSKKIFSITNPDDGEQQYYYGRRFVSGAGSYIGTSYAEEMDGFFDKTKTKYLVRRRRDEGVCNPTYVTTDIILLTESDSKEEAIRNNLEGIYNTINEESYEDTVAQTRISILYVSDLAATDGLIDFMPFMEVMDVCTVLLSDFNVIELRTSIGTTLYSFRNDAAPSIKALVENKENYSEQIYDALKNRQYVSTILNNDRIMKVFQGIRIDKETLYELIYEEQKDERKIDL